jgi:hypothetical protein
MYEDSYAGIQRLIRLLHIFDEIMILFFDYKCVEWTEISKVKAGNCLLHLNKTIYILTGGLGCVGTS